jgi:hypothetical protein
MSRRQVRLSLIAVLAVSLLLAPAVSARQPAGGGPSASARVFVPNPVATSGDNTLRDLKDADQAILNDERVAVTLTHLDGSGYLRGDYAIVVSSTGDPAFETDGTYDYTRHDDRFEQVMAYYWVTESQLYLQSLGFGGGGPFPAVNADQQRVRINQWGVDNSFATTHPRDEMRFGKGGVDDAEDGDVILHELGHQIHFSQSDTFFGTLEAGAISEGFGDYWAFTVSKAVTADLGLPAQFDPACIAKWDATSYDSNPVNGICLRRIDSDLVYPDDLVGQVHADGRIWSHALYDLHTAIGQERADTAILLAQFGWTGTDMPELASRIAAMADAQYGTAVAAQARATFEARGIL